MTMIAILPESPGSPTTTYRAVAGDKQSVGHSAGQVLDALTAQLSEAESGTLVVVKKLRFVPLRHPPPLHSAPCGSVACARA